MWSGRSLLFSQKYDVTMVLIRLQGMTKISPSSDLINSTGERDWSTPTWETDPTILA